MIVPVILSGGAGTRLWPLSRESHPKPFLKLPDGKSLLQKTFARVSSLEHVAEIMTITNKDYFIKTKPQYEEFLIENSSPPLSFLLEPFGRNTASATALALLKVLRTHGPDAILLILPADHLIDDIQAFHAACKNACTLAKMDKLVTLGIKPRGPETGFGYIERGTPEIDQLGFVVKRFVEKPSASKAAQFLDTENYFWNAGIFCCKADTLYQEFMQHAPDIIHAAKICWENFSPHAFDNRAFTFDTKSFMQLRDISLDYALLEKSKKISVVPCSFNWQDIGSWVEYKKLHLSDKEGNTVIGEAIVVDSRNTFIHSEKRMVASIGVDNLIIIDTPDALLITHEEKVQDVKQVVQKLKLCAHETYKTNSTVERPWGSYTILNDGLGFKVKRIQVSPGASLSLQSHEHRSEHWVIVEGVAKIINGSEERLAHENSSVYIPKGQLHRLTNPSKEFLIVIEVQIGNYLSEDDIMRYDDLYGRAM